MYFQPVTQPLTGFLFARHIQTQPIESTHANVLTLDQIHQYDLSRGYVWVHLDKTDLNMIDWLHSEPLVDNTVLMSLCADDSRPRTIKHADGVLINLRAINFNPDKNPEEMVSIALWITEKIIISVQSESILSINQLKDQIDAGELPCTQVDFLATLIQLLLENMTATIEALEDAIDIAEEEVVNNRKNKSSIDLANVRRKAFMLRRYLLPQKEALHTFNQLSLPWLANDRLLSLKELVDKTTFLTEELSEVRDRATLVHGQFAERREVQMNNTMLLLAVVSVIFMPMGLIAGLMGMNVGGVPWTQNNMGFVLSCLLTCSVGVTTAIVLKIGASLFKTK